MERKVERAKTESSISMSRICFSLSSHSSCHQTKPTQYTQNTLSSLPALVSCLPSHRVESEVAASYGKEQEEEAGCLSDHRRRQKVHLLESSSRTDPCRDAEYPRDDVEAKDPLRRLRFDDVWHEVGVEESIHIHAYTVYHIHYPQHHARAVASNAS